MDSMEEIMNVQAHDSEILCLEFSKPDTGEKQPVNSLYYSSCDIIYFNKVYNFFFFSVSYDLRPPVVGHSKS